SWRAKLALSLELESMSARARSWAEGAIFPRFTRLVRPSRQTSAMERSFGHITSQRPQRLHELTSLIVGPWDPMTMVSSLLICLTYRFGKALKRSRKRHTFTHSMHSQPMQRPASSTASLSLYPDSLSSMGTTRAGL